MSTIHLYLSYLASFMLGMFAASQFKFGEPIEPYKRKVIYKHGRIIYGQRKIRRKRCTNPPSDTCGEEYGGYIEITIPTLEGKHIARHGDYIIKGVHGEFYPCKPNIFEQTYEKVEEIPENNINGLKGTKERFMKEGLANLSHKTSIIIAYDSDQAAEYRTNIEGWVSRNKWFYGEDEEGARYDGCTHWRCRRCGRVTEKKYTYCPECRNLRQKKAWLELEARPWEENALYSENYSAYFISEDELMDFCNENDIRHPIPENLMAVLTAPVRPREFVLEDYLEDVVDPDGPEIISDDLKNAAKRLNEELRKIPDTLFTPEKFRWNGDIKDQY